MKKYRRKDSKALYLLNNNDFREERANSNKRLFGGELDLSSINLSQMITQ
jgi:hypothetical protein